MEPAITKLPDDRMGLSKDESTIFVDAEGNPTQKTALSWTEMPSAMGTLESLPL